MRYVKSKPTFTFTIGEVNLITEALKMRASRHESMARGKPHNAAQHERTAEAMRKLYDRFCDEVWEDG